MLFFPSLTLKLKNKITCWSKLVQLVHQIVLEIVHSKCSMSKCQPDGGTRGKDDHS